MNYNHFVIARVIHILGIVLWIGGVAFVTTVLIPSIRKTQSPENRLKTLSHTVPIEDLSGPLSG